MWVYSESAYTYTELSSKKEIMLLKGQTEQKKKKKSTLMHEKWESGCDKMAPGESQKALEDFAKKNVLFNIN